MPEPVGLTLEYEVFSRGHRDESGASGTRRETGMSEFIARSANHECDLSEYRRETRNQTAL
jgi:hypothetical protein